MGPGGLRSQEVRQRGFNADSSCWWWWGSSACSRLVATAFPARSEAEVNTERGRRSTGAREGADHYRSTKGLPATSAD